MVGAGFFLLALAAWLAWRWRKSRALPESRWFWRAAVLAAPAAAAAMEAGWTELGRQPWAVYGFLRTDAAVSTAPGLFAGFYVLLAVYTVLTISTLHVLRRMATANRRSASAALPVLAS